MDENICKSPIHHNHICYLKAINAVEDLEKVTSKPTVECTICGSKANTTEDVCSTKSVLD